jgi:hypothetical protein
VGYYEKTNYGGIGMNNTTFYTDTWYFKLLSWRYGSDAAVIRKHRSICSYAKAVLELIIAALLVALIGSVAIGFAVTAPVFVLVLKPFFGFNVNDSLLGFFYIISCIEAALIFFAIFSFIYKKFNWGDKISDYFDRRTIANRDKWVRKYSQPKEPNIFVEWYKATKGKMCPMIDYKNRDGVSLDGYEEYKTEPKFNDPKF